MAVVVSWGVALCTRLRGMLAEAPWAGVRSDEPGRRDDEMHRPPAVTRLHGQRRTRPLAAPGLPLAAAHLEPGRCTDTATDRPRSGASSAPPEREGAVQCFGAACGGPRPG